MGFPESYLYEKIYWKKKSVQTNLHMYIGDWIDLTDFLPFYKVDNFCDFFFLSHNKPNLKKMSVLKGKNLLLLGANSFHLDLFLEG